MRALTGAPCRPLAAVGIVLISLNAACIVAYFVLFGVYTSRTFEQLRKKPYNKMRMANLSVRIAVRHRAQRARSARPACVLLLWPARWAAALAGGRSGTPPPHARRCG